MAGTSAPIDRAESNDASLAILRKLAAAGFFTFLLSLSAQFKIPMPPDGVPQTLQTLVVALAAMGLGGRWGMVSVLMYIAIGALGAGVFSEGKAGIGVLVGQTGGYLLGFVIAQPVISSIIRRKDNTVRGWAAIVTAMLAGHAVIFLIGVPWLAHVREFPIGRAIQGGFVPFIPGMVVKTIAAVFIGLAAWPRSARRFW
ncbi:MAG: biotin transporter BioY [Phycisphaera sp.]|nr:MAG: biotin transporter BioY [Phycisphaera sp.]